MYQIVKNYRDNKALRDSFNALAEKIFGLNFEGWYQNGFWGDNYNPYSVVLDGQVVANVSLNRTDMLVDGKRKRLYQLGTVMTDEAYRNRGLIRAIMAEIEKDIADADGVYLFANDSVSEFYPKFGFLPGREFICTKAVSQKTVCTMECVPMRASAEWDKLSRVMEDSVFRYGCRIVDNPGLIFFYVSQFMQENVYYSKELDAWAVADIEDGHLMLQEVFADSGVSLDDVIGAFGPEIQKVTLGFTPADTESWTVEDYHEEDCNFFVKGGFFAEYRQLRIPALSHA